MTTIYLPLPQDGFELCQPTSPADFERLNVTINGQRLAGTWRSPRMQVIRESEGTRLSTSDAPWLGGHALIFRPTVLGVLAPLLERWGELLPVDCNEPDLMIYNVTTVIDALDEATTTATRFPDGRLMMVKRYGFRAEIVRGVEAFKIPNFRVSPTFVSEAFVDAWNRAGGVGLSFKALWSSEP